MIDPIDLSAFADLFQQGDGQIAADMFCELVQATENLQSTVRSLQIKCAMPRWKSQPIEQAKNSIEGLIAQQPNLRRISRIDGDADSDRFSMVQPIRGHRFKLVRSPVAEIERPGAARFEWVTGAGNVIKMKGRGLLNKICHHGRLMRPKRSRMIKKPVEKLLIAYQRHLYGFGHPGDEMSGWKCTKEVIIVDHCNRDSKRTEKIFNLKPVNPRFYPQPSISLGQKGCRHSNIPHTSMCCSSGESGHIKNGPTPDRQDNRVAIDMKVM